MEKNKQDKSTELGTYLAKKAGLYDENDSIPRQNEGDSEQNSISTSDGVLDSKSIETVKYDKRGREKPKRSWLKHLSRLFVVLTVLAVIYSALFILAPLIITVPAMILYIIWFVVVVLVSVFTVGIIWINEGWRDFTTKFLNVNNNLWDFANHAEEYLAGTFGYFATGLGALIIGSIVVSTIGLCRKKYRVEGYKASLITTIVLAVVYISFIIIDLTFINSGKTVI